MKVRRPADRPAFRLRAGASEFTLKSRDEEPVRRLEIFTGSGRRREWPPEEKARVVAESYKAGETVCAVARRYGLAPQQLFTLRRAARRPMRRQRYRNPCSCRRW